MVDHVGERFGDYRLKRLISNRGAFADVYEGEHVVDQTKAAVKVWKKQIEAKTFLNDVHAAVLRHPHIVEILDFGIKGDLPYLIMAYAPHGSLKGQTLPLPLLSIVVYVQQIAQALEYAHLRGIVHRDIKPDNILLGPQHEIWVGDFGIATPSFTRQDTLLGVSEKRVTGTPDYMAPEQWEDQVSPASDQYALGIMVYEWLCGKRPFRGNLIALYQKHRDESPPPLRDKVSTISPAVEQVVMKALQKAPEERYTSIQEFSNALEKAALVSNQVQSATSSFPTGTAFHTFPGLSGCASPIAWLVSGPYLASSDIDGTIHIWSIPDTGLVHTYPSEYSQHTRPLVWSPDGRLMASSSDQTVQIWDIHTRDCLLTYREHSTVVSGVAWSPNGTHIASCDTKMTHIWKVATGERILTRDDFPDSDGFPILEGEVIGQTALAWSPDAKSIASYRSAWHKEREEVVEVWDSITGSLISKYAMPRKVARDGSTLLGGLPLSLAWSHDGAFIASGPCEKDSSIHIWEAAKGKHRVSIRDYFIRSRHHDADVVSLALAWSPNGKYIASNSLFRGVYLWDATTGSRISPREHIAIYHEHSDIVEQIAWSPDGSHVASASWETNTEGMNIVVQVWNAPTPFGRVGFLRVEEGKELGQIYEIHKEELSIGRSAGITTGWKSDIFLRDRTVSLRQATVFNQGNGNYALRDDASVNGSQINGQQLIAHQLYPLREGDRIQLGETVLVFGTKAI